jgi:hypothetical protein
MPSVDGNNYPGPWEIRINYTAYVLATDRPHQLRVNVDVDTDPGPGSDFVDYDLVSRAGLYYNAETFTDALIALLQPLYHTNSNFVNAELWKYASGSYNAAFQSAYTIAVAGSSATADVLNGQAILTFRSQNGGSARVNLMESTRAAGATLSYPTAIGAVDDLFDFVTDSQSPMLARDGGYLFSPLNYLPGLNERLFKKTYRDL